MRRIRRFSLQINHSRVYSSAVFDEGFDLNDYISPDEEALSLPRPRYDWRGRASSRRRPGGLIDPPLKEGEKVHYPKRYKLTMEPLSMGEKWYDEIQNYKERCGVGSFPFYAF